MENQSSLKDIEDKFKKIEEDRKKRTEELTKISGELTKQEIRAREIDDNLKFIKIMVNFSLRNF